MSMGEAIRRRWAVTVVLGCEKASLISSDNGDEVLFALLANPLSLTPGTAKPLPLPLRLNVGAACTSPCRLC